MVKRRKKESEAVSLFPFLSILACIIGVLTLLIVGLSLSQMDDSVIENARQYQEVRAQEKTTKEQIDALNDLVDQARIVRKQLEYARTDLERLEKYKNELLGKDDLLASLAVEASRLRDRIAELEPELKKLLEEIKKLREELKKRKVSKEAEVKILPGGSGSDLNPNFVECTANGIVIYDGPQPKRVRRADLRSDKTFLALLDRIAKQQKTTVTFLVRTDGVGTYQIARSVARSRFAHNGKLAVIGQGKIDLSLFTKKR